MYSQVGGNLIKRCVVLAEGVRALVDRSQNVEVFTIHHGYTMHYRLSGAKASTSEASFQGKSGFQNY